MNVIFIPISIVSGMAGTYRLKNFLKSFDKAEVKYSSITISKNTVEKNRVDYEHSVTYKNKIGRLFIPFMVISKLYKLKQRKSKNILYHYGYPSVLNIHIVLLAKLIGYKVIYDIVEDNKHLPVYDSYLSRFRIKTSLLLLNKIEHYADGVIVISWYLKKKLDQIIKRHRIPILLIPISVDIDEFNEQNNASNETVVFYGGSFGFKEGIGVLLRAFDRLSHEYNTRLVLSGKGSEKDMEVFFTELEKLNNKSKVDYLGYLSRNEYVRQLSNADIHCMIRNSSKFANAGFPFKLGEMLATANPVICTDVGEVTDYLTNKESALIIPPDSQEQLYLSLKFLIDNALQAQEIGNKGRDVAFLHFNSDNHGVELVDFFRNKL